MRKIVFSLVIILLFSCGSSIDKDLTDRIELKNAELKLDIYEKYKIRIEKLKEIKKIKAAEQEEFDKQRKYDEMLFDGVEKNDAEKVKNAIEKGADINCVLGMYGSAPIYIAAKNANIEIAKILISNGVDINHMPGSIAQPPLFSAVRSGDVNIVNYFIKNGADINITFSDHYSPLQMAIEINNLEIVKALVEAGVDIEDLDYLTSVIRQGYKEILEYFISIGVNIKTKNDRTLIDIAKACGRYELIDVLEKAGVKETPGLEELFLKKIIAKLDKDYDVNAFDDHQLTLLNDACSSGYLSAVKHLIEKGADVDLCNQFGWTPLLSASINGHTDVIKYLLEKGADIDGGAWNNYNVYTHLMYSIEYRQKKSAKTLIKNGADVNFKSGDNKTALKLAREKEMNEIVGMLVAAGAKE